MLTIVLQIEDALIHSKKYSYDLGWILIGY